MLDRSNPDADVVVGGDCDDEFLRQAMSIAQQCGAPMAGANAGAACNTIVGPRMTTVGAPASLALAANASATITITSRKGLLVGNRLVLPASIAEALVVTDVSVGGTTIMPSGDPIFGEAFSSANQRGGHLPFIPAPVSQIITVTVTNVSDAAVDVRVALSGAVL